MVSPCAPNVTQIDAVLVPWRRIDRFHGLLNVEL